METLLVTGIDHVVGANVACTLAGRYRVVGLSRSGATKIDGCQVLHGPAEEAGFLRRSVLEASPAWIVHCGEIARPSWDQVDAHAGRLANEPWIAATLAETAGQAGSSLTVMSSDAVFAGPGVFHNEESRTTGTGPLAEAARAVEEALAGRENTLIVRTHAYGWSPVPQHAGYAQRYWEALDAGLAPVADTHRHATPILASDLAEMLHEAHQLGAHQLGAHQLGAHQLGAHRRGLQGLYHLAGGERTNPRRFVQELATACGFATSYYGCQTAIPDEPPHPAPETSFISIRGRDAIGQPMPMLQEGLERFADQRNNGYLQRLQGSGESALRASAA